MLSHRKHTKYFLLILDSAVKFNGSVLSDINSFHIFVCNRKQYVQKSVPILSYDVSDYQFLYGESSLMIQSSEQII